MACMEAKWIWSSEAERGEEQFVLFRKELFLQEISDEYWIQITADSRYKIFVNGVCCGFGPAKGNREEWYLDELDLSSYLQKGENIILVQVLHYSVDTGKGNRSIYRTKTPGLYMKGITETTFVTDASWMTYVEKGRKILAENPFFSPLYIYEEVFSEGSLVGVLQEGYQKKNWKTALVYPDDKLDKRLLPECLVKRPFPNCYQKMRKFSGVVSCPEGEILKEEWKDFLEGNKVLHMKENSTEIVEITAGELMCGFLNLVVCGGKGSSIKILQAESYVESVPFSPVSYSELPVKGNRSDYQYGILHGYTDVFYPSGEGREKEPEVYEPFWFRTFRYIRLEIRTENVPLVLRSLAYRETGYPLELKETAKKKVEKLQQMAKGETPGLDMDRGFWLKLWEISLRTLKRCMHDTYMDCPFYEQLQYAMDARTEILYTYAVSDDDRLAKQCMNAFRLSDRADGLLNCSAPDVGENVIPGFSIYYIGMLYDHMKYFGDREWICNHLSVVEGILNFFHRHLDARGLVERVGGVNDGNGFWSFIDWTKEWDSTDGVPGAVLSGPVTMESFLYLYGLQMAAELFRFAGREETFKERAEKLKEAIQSFCMDEEGVFLDGPGVQMYSQHCQVFAVITDTVSLEKGGGLLKRTLKEKEKFSQCSVAMRYYLFRALEKCGLYDQTKELWEPWKKMIEQNLTTCAEDELGGRSDCHAWGSLFLYEFMSL